MEQLFSITIGSQLPPHKNPPEYHSRQSEHGWLQTVWTCDSKCTDWSQYGKAAAQFKKYPQEMEEHFDWRPNQSEGQGLAKPNMLYPCEQND